jgi:hypothetical protein
MSPEPKMERLEQHYWIPEFEELIKSNKDDKYLDPDKMLTLKASHSGFGMHWQKTMSDIVFLKSKGFKMDKPLYYKLVKAWKRVHGVKWASLKDKDSESFFKDAVKRKYIHDDLHLCCAYYDEPLYFKILKDGSGSVNCCENKFNLLSYEDQIKLVKEEVFVTALERYLIVNEFGFSRKLAYHRSLQKLMVSMSSGWFKYFMIDNYEDLRSHKDMSFVEKFKEWEKAGKLRLVEK